MRYWRVERQRRVGVCFSGRVQNRLYVHVRLQYDAPQERELRCSGMMVIYKRHSKKRTQDRGETIRSKRFDSVTAFWRRCKFKSVTGSGIIFGDNFKV